MGLDLAALCIVVFSLIMYVILDGFDLGVGVLLPMRPDERDRDDMVATVAPTWDGNETWLILAGVGLLACFPIAYSTLLPAFYIPMIAMLLALGFRGVSFEFRFQAVRWRRFWDGAFAWGSFFAAFCQGLIVGGALQGITIADFRFSGGPWDFLSPFSLLTGIATVFAYAALGAAWLIGKATEPVVAFARVALGVACACLGVFATAVFAGAVIAQPGLGQAWDLHGGSLATLGLIFYLFLAAAPTVGARLSGAVAFATLVVAYMSVIAGLLLCLGGTIVPFRLSYLQAASANASEAFFVVGGIVVIPVILGYTALSYAIFRGRARVPEDAA